jgi:outer membrane protein assembly factor BamB
VGADGTVYFGCRDRKLYALSAAGKKAWEFKTGAWVDSSPALASDGTIYFGSWDKTFYALNPGGGVKWKFPIEGEIVSSPAVGLDGTVYFGAHDRKFYALGPDGKKHWEYATGGSIISSPALNPTNVYFTSVDGYFYALNYEGQLRWRLKTGGITESSPVIGLDGSLYVGVNETVWAITPEGKKKWEQTTPWPDFFFEATPLVLADGSVCHISRYGMLMNVESEQHHLNWMYYPGYGYASPAVGPKGTIYFGFLRIGLDGFGALRTRVPLAKTSWPKFRGNPRNTGNLRDSEG